MIAANAALAGIKNACRGARPFAAAGKTGNKTGKREDAECLPSLRLAK
jgi:hypothetical protein